MAKTIICYHQFLATNAMLPHDVRSIVFLVTMSFFLHIQPKSSCNHMNANFPDPTFFRNFRNYKMFLLFFSAFMYAFKICCLQLRQASIQKIVILGVVISEACYKTGHVRTSKFMVSFLLQSFNSNYLKGLSQHHKPWISSC